MHIAAQGPRLLRLLHIRNLSFKVLDQGLTQHGALAPCETRRASEQRLVRGDPEAVSCCSRQIVGSKRRGIVRMSAFAYGK